MDATENERDATEITEIQMRESEIRQLKTEKQSLLEEMERLRSAAYLRKKAQSDLLSELHLLQSEKESMETKFSKIVLGLVIQIQELKDKSDGLRSELDVKSEEAEKLFLDLQELEKTRQEDQMVLRKEVAERAWLLEEKERWDDRVEKIVEESRVIILKLLTSQSDLKEQMNRKDAMLEAFTKKVLGMVRRTRAIVDCCPVPAGGDDGETNREKDDDEIGNVVTVMAALVEQELKQIEAAVASAASWLLGRRR